MCGRTKRRERNEPSEIELRGEDEIEMANESIQLAKRSPPGYAKACLGCWNI